MSDNVEHPSHYNAGGVETIEGIKAALGDGFSDYCLGNVLKYVWRCKHKGKLLEDLRKAAKYLEWAIEAAESNCPVVPDSSSGKALAIPEGFRELEPDETPLATDMHEWMGGWVPRKDDATNTYIWHSRRHIRKIETLKPKPLAIPDGWRELEENEPLSEDDLFDFDGEWVGHEYDPSGGVYSSRIHRRHIRKIEPASPPEVPNGSNSEPLAIPEGWRELETGEALSKNDMYCRDGKWNPYVESNPAGSDFPRYSKGIHYKHIRKIETANVSETPNSSLPNPGSGYRLLSKEPPEPVVEGDEYLDIDGEWTESENWRTGSVQCSAYYRRKIETTAWIPKVGDRVRVVRGFINAVGEVGIITELCQEVNGNFAILAGEGRCTLGWFKKDDVKLIEAAS